MSKGGEMLSGAQTHQTKTRKPDLFQPSDALVPHYKDDAHFMAAAIKH